MTENEYQIEVQDLWEDMQARANTAVDYIVTQPPIRLARQELYALLEWAFQAGIDHQDVIAERMRRRALAARKTVPGQPGREIKAP